MQILELGALRPNTCTFCNKRIREQSMYFRFEVDGKVHKQHEDCHRMYLELQAKNAFIVSK